MRDGGGHVAIEGTGGSFETFARLMGCPFMTLNLDTLLEGSPAYGVVDAKDGAVLFSRPGHEAAFDAMAAEAMDASGDAFEVIPLTDDNDRCDRLFIVPLNP